MKERQTEINWPKTGTSFIAAYGGSMLSEDEVRRLQSKTSSENNEQTDKPDAPEQTGTDRKTRKTLALRTAISPANKIKDKITNLLFPEGYSVFIRRKPRQ